MVPSPSESPRRKSPKSKLRQSQMLLQGDDIDMNHLTSMKLFYSDELTTTTPTTDSEDDECEDAVIDSCQSSSTHDTFDEIENNDYDDAAPVMAPPVEDLLVRNLSATIDTALSVMMQTTTDNEVVVDAAKSAEEQVPPTDLTTAVVTRDENEDDNVEGVVTATNAASTATTTTTSSNEDVVHQKVVVRNNPSTIRSQRLKQIIHKQIKQSSLLQSDSSKTILQQMKRYHLQQDICIGRKLGNGSFCMVHEVGFMMQQENDTNHKGMEYPYAMKRIEIHHQNKKIKEDAELQQGIVDLIMEVQYLSVLSHRHIISVHGASPYMIQDPNDGTTNTVTKIDYYDPHFVILDKLQYTLSSQLKKWKVNQYHHKNNNGLSKLLFDFHGKKEVTHFMKRLQYGYDIANAIQYLHSNNIMYRDLKPDNVGFDADGVLKIFDLGLLREYNPEKPTSVVDGIKYYNLTAETGSFLYMDPIVALGLPYNELCDVYSFCIVLWQILQLESPYVGYNMQSFRTKVFANPGKRPTINEKWPLKLQHMIQAGWSYDYKDRPTMESICSTLHELLTHHQENGSCVMEDHSILRRKSVSRTPSFDEDSAYHHRFTPGRVKRAMSA